MYSKFLAIRRLSIIKSTKKMEDNYTYNPETKRFLKEEEFTPKPQDGGLSDILKFAVLAIAIVLPIRIFIAQPFIVSGTSMVPTFLNGEYIIVDQLSYHLREPERGEVIIFKFPEDPSKYFIKRVIAVPGDTVRITGNEVFISNPENPEGIRLDEPYIKNPGASDINRTIEDGEYFVLGDNRASSYDSRFWGVLTEKYVVGRAFIRLFPLSKVDILPGEFEY